MTDMYISGLFARYDTPQNGIIESLAMAESYIQYSECACVWGGGMELVLYSIWNLSKMVTALGSHLSKTASLPVPKQH